MADEQDQAEALDADVRDADYPPEEPMGVDDPTQDDRVEDSITERARREEPEGPDGDDRPVIQPYVDEDEARLDEEDELVAEAMEDAADLESDGAPPPAEEAALHLEE